MEIISDQSCTYRQYDIFVSIGTNCEVSAKIRTLTSSFESSFFSWAKISSPQDVYNCLLAGCDLLLSKATPVSNNMFKYSEYNIAFHGRTNFNEIQSNFESRVLEAENEVICRQSHLWNKFFSYF